jgi:hypothetical protein
MRTGIAGVFGPRNRLLPHRQAQRCHHGRFHSRSSGARPWLPEIGTDGYTPYRTAIRDAFGNRVAHGIITKTYSVTHWPKAAVEGHCLAASASLVYAMLLPSGPASPRCSVCRR